MAGNFCTEDKLNNTLLKVVNCFKKNNFNTWFIAYGTLLGIVRNNSCIDGDDDIDIICDRNDIKLLKQILLNANFELEYGYGIGETDKIIKTKETKKYASIDFYMTEVNANGDFNDLWERTVWRKCFKKNRKDFIKIEWNGVFLNLPNNYINKLRARYGDDWKIPIKFKGIQRSKYKTFFLDIFFLFPFKLRQKIKLLVYKNNKVEKLIRNLFMGNL